MQPTPSFLEQGFGFGVVVDFLLYVGKLGKKDETRLSWMLTKDIVVIMSQKHHLASVTLIHGHCCLN